VLERGINRLAIGLGMIPRGEVGLIFAGIGTQLTVINAAGNREAVINEATFGAVVIMVIVTTLVTPPALKWSMSRSPAIDDADETLEESVQDDIERTMQ
jgi:Kef-type K+ transport system membrane component KefB